MLIYCFIVKATQAKTWICFDGPLSGTWVDILEGLISKDKVYALVFNLYISSYLMCYRYLACLLENDCL